MAHSMDQHLQGIWDRLEEVLDTHSAAVYLTSFYRAGPPRIFVFNEIVRLLVKNKVGIHYEEPPIDLEAKGYHEVNRGNYYLAYEFSPGRRFELEMPGILMEKRFTKEELMDAVREMRDKLGYADIVPLLELRPASGRLDNGVTLRIKKLDPDIEPPQYAHVGDAGMDIRSAEEVVMEPGERAMVSTAFAMALPEGYAAFIQPRSGLAARNGISLVNTPGLIDCHYRGEVKIILINLGGETFTVKRGDRIAQMVIQRVEDARVECVEELDETTRGEGGFGSTGL
ncbi:MAG: dUTP diphosphatase [Actinomycetota bacterium]|nr:dUTP diphosphatase [Actinomycetota bacterium]